jgi:putative transposase
MGAGGHKEGMPHISRIVVPGVPFHVVQRGNHRDDVFLSDLDRRVFLQLLEKYSQRYRLRILGYCLMSNHYHVVCEPEDPASMAWTFRLTNHSYSRWLHVQKAQTGQLWQGRYRSCALDNRHLWNALCYVEQNPVRAGMVSNALAWPWSSAATHVEGRTAPITLDMERWRSNYTSRSWAEVLEWGVRDAGFVERLRQANETGRPVGSIEFMERMEVCLGRPVRPQKPGRKPKSGNEVYVTRLC